MATADSRVMKPLMSCVGRRTVQTGRWKKVFVNSEALKDLKRILIILTEEIKEMILPKWRRIT